MPTRNCRSAFTDDAGRSMSQDLSPAALTLFGFTSAIALAACGPRQDARAGDQSVIGQCIATNGGVCSVNLVIRDTACTTRLITRNSDGTATIHCDQLVSNLLVEAQPTQPPPGTPEAVAATLQDSPDLRDRFTATVEHAATVEQNAEALPEEKKDAVHALLVKGKVTEADEVVKEELDPKFLRLGGAFTFISDKKIGNSGWAAGMAISGPLDANGVVSKGASLILAAQAVAVFGKVELSGVEKFAMSFAGQFGPRLRLGYPFGLTLGAYYDLPLLNANQGSAYFPLVGGAADAGFQLGFLRLTCLYRYDANSILYPHRPNLSFLGGVATFAPQR